MRFYLPYNKAIIKPVCKKRLTMQNTSHQNNYNDEIDLFELFSTIWRGKWLIIAITIIGILLAGAYAFTAKEQWTAKAQVRIPEQRQLKDYLQLEQTYSRYASTDSSVTVDPTASLEEAFTIFSTNLFALNERFAALRESDYYQSQAELSDNDVAKARLLHDMASHSFSVSEAIKDNRFIYNVQFSATTPQDAQATLIQMLKRMNTEAIELLYERLENRINNTILAQQTQSQRIQTSHDQLRANKILELKQALQSAREAGITDYTGDSPVVGNSIIDLKSSDMLFMLGDNYLEAQLNTLLETEVIYPTSYYEIQRNTERLKELLPPEVEGQAFIYTQAPELPLVKDKPRKALILILGALLGGIFGVFYVLLRSAINNRRQNQVA